MSSDVGTSGDEEDGQTVRPKAEGSGYTEPPLVRPPLPGRKVYRKTLAGEKRRKETPHLNPHLEQRESAGDPPDPFWMEVRGHAVSERQQTNEESEVEGDRGLEVVSPVALSPTAAAGPPCCHFAERCKQEKKRMKSLRRRQKRRERWRQESSTEEQSSSSSSSSEDEETPRDRDGFICAVCLDVYFNPYMCHPCNHIFCEPCLRTLAKTSPANTPCPLCRTTITHVFFQKELNQTMRTFFLKEYVARKQNFQKASCSKWPLPNSRKLFRIFGGFQRSFGPVARRPFARHRLNALDFEDDSPGWRLDMDMIIIYIYSANWIIGFFVFCFLCYLFFPDSS